MTSSIPKIIHQMWLDKYVTNNTVAPPRYNPFIKSFIDYNPEFKYVLWNINKVKKLFKIPELRKYKNIWLSFPHHIQKCDMARMLVIYMYGGIYVDLDFTCFKNLSPLLNRELLLVLEPIEHDGVVDRKLFNGFFGSVPKNKFFLDWLDYVCECLKKDTSVHNTTSPENFRKFYNQSGYKVNFVDTCDIIPLYSDSKGNNYISKDCKIKHNLGLITDNFYTKLLNNYTHTKWKEGSGWGAEHLEIHSTNKLKIKTLSILFVILICIIILIILIVYLAQL